MNSSVLFDSTLFSAWFGFSAAHKELQQRFRSRLVAPSELEQRFRRRPADPSELEQRFRAQAAAPREPEQRFRVHFDGSEREGAANSSAQAARAMNSSV